MKQTVLVFGIAALQHLVFFILVILRQLTLQAKAMLPTFLPTTINRLARMAMKALLNAEVIPEMAVVTDLLLTLDLNRSGYL